MVGVAKGSSINHVTGGILFSYIPWKVSLSGEVGGYPQALPEVVTLRDC